MSDAWRNPAAPLKELAATLDIEIAAMAQSESPDALSYTNEEFPGSTFANLSPKQIQRLDAALQAASVKYDHTFTFEVRLGSRSLLAVGAGYDPKQLQDFLQKNQTAFEVQLRVDIGVDKKALLPDWGFADGAVVFVLFLFPAALERLLTRPLPELENPRNGLLKDADGAKTLIVLVPDHPIELAGDYLAILGGDAVAAWRDAVPKKSAPQLTKKAADAHELAEKSLVRWLSFSLRMLTPLQLNLRWKEGAAPAADDAIAGALYAQLFTCSVLYMAAMSIRNKEGATSLWTSTFASDKYLAKLEIVGAAALRGEVTFAAARRIGSLAVWVYRYDRAGDRLAIVQNVVASSLQDNPPETNCRELARMADEIFQRVLGGWTSFIGKKLDEYFAHSKDFEETIAAAAKSYDEQVQALTGTLIANMLAAVAVIVGTFIAAMFKSPFDGKVFVVGALVYVVYLVIFPIGFGLTATYARFEQSRQTFDWRKKKFTARLPDATVRRIIGGAAPDREQWFQGWFWTTATAYATIALLFLAATFTVPDLMRHWSDEFSLQSAERGNPAGDLIPITVRGEHFDKEKEIVATAGRATFTNTGDALKVHGSTILTFSAHAADLAGTQSVSVRQGTAGPKSVPLR